VRGKPSNTFAALGVRELWPVDIERRTIELRALEGTHRGWRETLCGDARVESAVFPGLSVPVGEIFTAS
jgi:Uma2 family endonuclease